MTTKGTILCGSCRTPVNGPSDAQDHDIITCPGCGRSDPMKVVRASIAAFVEDSAGRRLQESLRKATKGSRFVTFTSKPIPHRSYRYIVDIRF